MTRRQARGLNTFIKQTTNLKEKRRALAVRDILSGSSYSEVARSLRIEQRNHIYEWVRNFQRYGAEGLKMKKAGRKPLSLIRLIDTLLILLTKEKPMDYGFDTQFWSLSLLAKVLKKKRIKKQISRSYLCKIMKRTKFRENIYQGYLDARQEAIAQRRIYEENDPVIQTLKGFYGKKWKQVVASFRHAEI